MMRYLRGLSVVVLVLAGFCLLLSGTQAAPGAGEFLTLSPRAYLPILERAAPCVGHGASMTLSATPATLRAGDLVTVTAALVNDGCATLSALEYRLAVAADGAQPVLQPAHPEPVVHYVVLSSGGSDSADFVLQATGPGAATVTAFASFEVQLGRGAPVFRSYSSASPLVITVTPLETGPAVGQNAPTEACASSGRLSRGLRYHPQLEDTADHHGIVR